MLNTGVKSHGGHIYKMAVLQCSGDWQWLAKAGHLNRSYSNVEKRPRRVGAAPRGICHLCQAGQVHRENFRADRVPPWWSTRFVECAFDRQPALCRVPYVAGEAEGFFVYDLFHSHHLGLGKTFTAACLALMSEKMSSSTVDGRFEELTHGYLQFCAETRQAPYLTTISKMTIGWPDKQQFPNGQWSKGHVTVSIGDYFASWAARQDFSDDHDDMLRLCRDANILVSRCFRMLYERDLWMTRDDASVISGLALSFLDAYRQLAKLASDRSKNRRHMRLRRSSSRSNTA